MVRWILSSTPGAPPMAACVVPFWAGWVLRRHHLPRPGDRARQSAIAGSEQIRVPGCCSFQWRRAAIVWGASRPQALSIRALQYFSLRPATHQPTETRGFAADKATICNNGGLLLRKVRPVYWDAEVASGLARLPHLT